MKTIVISYLLFCFLGLSCRKEFNPAIKNEDKAQVNLEFEGENKDDKDGLKDLADPEENEYSTYSFGGVAGLYFGCTSTFRTKDRVSLEISFGTSLTTNLKWTRAEFEKLISPGERTFGSLGSFTSFPQLKVNRVEIAYTDKKSRRWCSTRITEKLTGDGIETSVKIDQQRAKFVIDDIHKVEVAAETEGYRIKGHFECTLYEINGDGKKKIKGKFTGIVGS